MVAVRAGAAAGDKPLLVILEMKLGFTLELVLQGVDRLAMADQVWLAVAATQRGRDRDRRVPKLCRQLGFGLLAVHPGRAEAEVLAEPGPYHPRLNPRRRRALLVEHAARRGDPSPGGTRGVPVVTAYRQEALACAAALAAVPKRPRDLASQMPRAASILLRDVYGWFNRVERGLYALSPAGQAALERWGADEPAPSPAEEQGAVSTPIR